MRVFVYSIAADQDRPSDGDGYVRAETAEQAVALVAHPEVNIYRRRRQPVIEHALDVPTR
jgi:hypothetical protein